MVSPIYSNNYQAVGYNVFTSRIADYLDGAESVSDKILNPPVEGVQPRAQASPQMNNPAVNQPRHQKKTSVKVTYVHVQMGYPRPRRYRHHHHHHRHHYGHGVMPSAGPASNNKKKSDDVSPVVRAVVGILGVIMVGVVATQFKSFVKDMRTSSKIVKEIRATKKEVDKACKESGKSDLNIAKVKKVVDRDYAIFSRLRNRHIMNVALLVGVATAGVLLTVGAITGNPFVMIAGGVLGGAMGLFALAKWIYVRNDKSSQKDARVMDAALQSLQQAVHPLRVQNGADISTRNPKDTPMGLESGEEQYQEDQTQKAARTESEGKRGQQPNFDQRSSEHNAYAANPYAPMGQNAYQPSFQQWGYNVPGANPYMPMGQNSPVNPYLPMGQNVQGVNPYAPMGQNLPQAQGLNPFMPPYV